MTNFLDTAGDYPWAQRCHVCNGGIEHRSDPKYPRDSDPVLVGGQWIHRCCCQ